MQSSRILDGPTYLEIFIRLHRGAVVRAGIPTGRPSTLFYLEIFMRQYSAGIPKRSGASGISTLKGDH